MKKINNIINKLQGLIYPAVCINCKTYTRETLLCEKCAGLLQKTKSPRCMKCGKHIDDNKTEYCYDCKTNIHQYTWGFGAFEYSDMLKEAIYDFKYNGVKNLGVLFANEIVKEYNHEIKAWNADCIIPVPLHPKKIKKRGFNQAEIIGTGIGKNMGIPVLDNYLIRRKNTVPQKELHMTQRKKNLENAFIIQDNVVELKKVILVDDIYTTGTTIDQCATVLRKTGCMEIYYISLCIGNGI